MTMLEPHLEALAARRFVVVGAGGTGGRLARDLAKLLEYRVPGATLVLVDGDHFEPKNLERQEFMMVGNKAEVVAAELAQTLRATVVLPMATWVVAETVETDDEEAGAQIAASSLLREGDVVFTTVDNFAARAAIFEAAKDFATIDIFNGGNDEALFGSIQHYARRDGVELTEHPAYRHPEFVDPPDRNPGELNCAERAEIDGGVQLLATNAAVAAYLLARVYKTLIAGDVDAEAEIYFDLGLGLAQAFDRREVTDSTERMTKEQV